MEKYYKVSINEKETIINLDYYSKNLNIYTTRVACMKKLIRILGEPEVKGKIDGSINSMEWNVPFEMRDKIKSILALSVLIPQKKKQTI